MSDALLSLHHLQRSGTRALGPGLRYAIWTRGCPFRCPGCATPEARDIDGGTLVTVGDLAADIVAARGIDGISISGGEPMVQAASLAELLEEVLAERPSLTVILFTGFRLEELTMPEQQRLLKSIDLLVDGPYEEALNDGRGLRGSSNQRLHFLTPRLEPMRHSLEEGPRNIEISFSENCSRTVGMPTI